MIVSLVLLTMIGALVVPYFGTAIQRSADPIVGIRRSNELFTVMEKIAYDYEINYREDLTTLQTRVDSSPSPYGTYNVVTNAFITFDAAQTEQSGGTATDILKVTISNSFGHRLTMLFPYMP